MKQWQSGGFLPVAIALVVAAFAGCESPKTLSPDLEMTMGVPLLAETVEIGERVLKADSVRLNPRDTTQMQIYFAEDTVQIRDDGYIGQERLDVPPQDRQTVNYEVGLIEIDDVPPESSEPILLTEAVPELAAIPPGVTNFTFGGKTVPIQVEEIEFDNFQSVTFSDVSQRGLNRLRISFANRSPFLMQDVSVYLSTTGDTTAAGDPVESDLIIDPVVFPSVAAGDSATSDPVALANITMPGTVYMMFEMTAAAGTVPADEIPDSYVRLATDMTALEVVEANAALPPQQFEETKDIEFSSSELDLYRVILADMNVDYMNVYEFNLTNDLPSDVSIHYQLPNFLHIPEAPEGDVASLTPDTPDDFSSGTIYARPNQTLAIRFLMDNARFESLSGFALDKISITITTDILGSDGSFVQIQQTDGLELESYINQLAIARVEGRVPDGKPIVNEIEPFELGVQESGLPAGLSGLNATDIDVRMDVLTQSFTSTMDVDLKMRVYDPATMAESAFYERVLSENIEFGTEMNYRLTKDSLGAQSNSPLVIINSTLDNMFDSGQSTINMEGSVTVTGVVTLVRDSSRVSIPQMSLRSPMRFTMPPAVTFDAKSETDEAFDPGLSDEVKDDFIPRTVRATVFGEIESYFPSGGTLVMFASPDPYFTKLRQLYPADNQDDLATIPDRIPAEVNYSDELAAVREGAVFKLFTIELPEPTLLPDGSVDPANPGVTTDPLEVPLDDELAVFGYEKLYLLPRIQLQYGNDAIIRLDPDDRLELSLMMFLTAHTEKLEDTP